jgi:hypothetical protein
MQRVKPSCQVERGRSGGNRLKFGGKRKRARPTIFETDQGLRDLDILFSPEDEMSETPQQYTQRILGYIKGKQPVAVQAETAKKLDRLIKDVSTATLRKRPAPDKWSVSEILAHLADSEIVLGFRLRQILAVPGTPIAAVDQDSWVQSGHCEKRDPRKSVEQFRVVREANLALLKSLTPQEWKHYGMHSERGKETIEHTLRMYAGHDINHVQQIERILSAKRSG